MTDRPANSAPGPQGHHAHRAKSLSPSLDIYILSLGPRALKGIMRATTSGLAGGVCGIAMCGTVMAPAVPGVPQGPLLGKTFARSSGLSGTSAPPPRHLGGRLRRIDCGGEVCGGAVPIGTPFVQSGPAGDSTDFQSEETARRSELEMLAKLLLPISPMLTARCTPGAIGRTPTESPRSGSCAHLTMTRSDG